MPETVVYETSGTIVSPCPPNTIAWLSCNDPCIETLDRRRFPLIERLSLRHAFDDIDEHDGVSELLFGKTLRGRGADVPGTDDSDLVEHGARKLTRLNPGEEVLQNQSQCGR